MTKGSDETFRAGGHSCEALYHECGGSAVDPRPALASFWWWRDVELVFVQERKDDMSNAALLLTRSSLDPTNSVGKGILSGGGAIEIFEALEYFELFHGHAIAAVRGCDPFLNCSSLFFAEWLDKLVLRLDRVKGKEQLIESVIRKAPNALNKSLDDKRQLTIHEGIVAFSVGAKKNCPAQRSRRQAGR